MKRFIVQLNASFEAERVLAIAPTPEAAHTIAEALSYALHKNAVYGLFKIRILSRDELNALPNGFHVRHDFLMNL